MNHPYYKPLSEEPDKEDRALYDFNRDCTKATERLRELVPLMQFTQCNVVKIDQDETIIEVPLLEETMNQNGTHQASVFYLLADYTAGVAMFGALPGVYVTGVNDRCHGYPIQYWLKSGSVQHLVPAVKKIRGVASISKEEAARMREELIAKGVTEIEVSVKIYEDTRLVAEAQHRMGMYGDLPVLQGRKANMFQSQTAMLSATMIAGLKNDEISMKISTGLGSALANRMIYSSPELPEIVKAREKSLAVFYQSMPTDCQVVVLGLGLDSAPNRYTTQQWYGLDLRASIKKRKAIYEEHQIEDDFVVKIACDLRVDNLKDKLIKNGFNLTKVTYFVIEGLSMYLSKDHLQSCIKLIADIGDGIDKQIWIDHVTPEIFTNQDKSAVGFLENMSRLGEPFISGYEDLDALIDGEQLNSISKESTEDVLKSNNELHRLYWFSTIKLSG